MVSTVLSHEGPQSRRRPSTRQGWRRSADIQVVYAHYVRCEALTNSIIRIREWRSPCICDGAMSDESMIRNASFRLSRSEEVFLAGGETRFKCQHYPASLAER